MVRVREDDRMKHINWRAVGPILIVGTALMWLAIRRSENSSDPLLPWLVVVLPILLAGLVLLLVTTWFRRRKSHRTWDVMLHEVPNDRHFIAYVYPPVKVQLGKLGWRLHGPAYLSIPTVGLSLGVDSVTFWEAGAVGPTLTLNGSQFKSAKLGRVTDGYRDHPSIEVRLNSSDRNNRLELNLRDVRHHNLSASDMSEALQSIQVMIGLTRAESKDIPTSWTAD
jgi:hypothetical protein